MDTDLMQKIDVSNTLFTLAGELVNLTSKHVFLTGKAGTGKTTFLKHLRENCPKQMAIVAPTGVAAINAGGMTIHSFFQLPLAPYLPGTGSFRAANEEVSDKHSLLGRLRLNREKRRIIRELELLVIDEISMVRCDVLDAIDLVLRHVRHRFNESFGGVQLLFVGDLFQLPPVVKDPEWELLRGYYNSPYFFDSHVIREQPPVYIEFNKIYRQSEERFIHLLNRVRNNEMDDENFAALHERYQPGFFGTGAQGYILLTTHNEKAREINAAELAKLPGRIQSYKAGVEGDFPSTAFPADEQLQLKTGAQVMFIKNDSDKARRYFNGKIGTVMRLEEDKVWVQCREEEPIEVGRENWSNIRYTLDKTTRHLSEDVLGSFKQFPLRLAWAITIHKSQGLSFEKAVIDAGRAFAPGQVYVALSRCTNLEGLVLHSRIQPDTLFADERIVQFTRNALPIEGLKEELARAKKDYQEKIITSLFQFDKTIRILHELQKYVLQHQSSFNAELPGWIVGLQNKLDSLQATGEKFRQQLKGLFLLSATVEENTGMHERLKAAATWFGNELTVFAGQIMQSPALTDSAMHAKAYNDMLKEAFLEISLQQHLLQLFGETFRIENYHRRKKSFVPPSFGVNAYAGASEKNVELPHPALYYQLKKMRDQICSRRNQPIYMVAGSKTLEEMARFLPQRLDELEMITGFGKAKVAAHGKEFLSLIQDYCEANGLDSLVDEMEKKPKRVRDSEKEKTKQVKGASRAETYQLFRDGKSIGEIASARGLTLGTIEGHLSYFLRRGQIRIGELVDQKKIDLIEPMIKDHSEKSIAAIKQKLGDACSYGEIRLVMAWVAGQRSGSAAHVDH